eukprot:g47633.t1
MMWKGQCSTGVDKIPFILLNPIDYRTRVINHSSFDKFFILGIVQQEGGNHKLLGQATTKCHRIGVTLEVRVFQVALVFLDCLVHLVLKVILANQDSQVHLEFLVPRELMASQVLLALLDHLVHQVSQVLLEFQVLQERKDNQAVMVFQAEL